MKVIFATCFFSPLKSSGANPSHWIWPLKLLLNLAELGVHGITHAWFPRNRPGIFKIQNDTISLIFFHVFNSQNVFGLSNISTSSLFFRTTSKYFLFFLQHPHLQKTTPNPLPIHSSHLNPNTYNVKILFHSGLRFL